MTGETFHCVFRRDRCNWRRQGRWCRQGELKRDLSCHIQTFSIKVGDRVLAQLLTEMDGVEGLEGVSETIETEVPKAKMKCIE